MVTNTHCGMETVVNLEIKVPYSAVLTGILNCKTTTSLLTPHMQSLYPNLYWIFSLLYYFFNQKILAFINTPG